MPKTTRVVIDTQTHPDLSGEQIAHYIKLLRLTYVEAAHLLGYRSDRPERLRDRMHEFVTEKKPLMPAQARLLLLMVSFVFAGTEEDPIEDLLEHGDFFFGTSQ